MWFVCTSIPKIIRRTQHAIVASNLWLHCGLVSTFCLRWGLPPARVHEYPACFCFGLHDARLYKLASFSCLSVVVTQLPFFIFLFFLWEFLLVLVRRLEKLSI